MNAKDLAIIVSLVGVLLSSCVATPTKYNDRIGDFVTNIAAATHPSGTSRG